MGTERRSKQMHSLTSMPSILMLRCFRRLRIHTNTTKLLAGDLHASSIITQSSPSEESHSSANTGLPRCCIFFAVRCSKEYGTGDFVNASFGQFGRYGTKRVRIGRSRRAATTALHMSSRPQPRAWRRPFEQYGWKLHSRLPLQVGGGLIHV